MVSLIDGHVHFWDLGADKRPWLRGNGGPDALRYGDYAAIRRDYLPRDYLVDAAPHDVVGLVYLKAMWDAADPVGETVWLSGIRHALSILMVIVAQTKLD
jgi:predicted TIM-barrel fold metal-dependent hydrolase